MKRKWKCIFAYFYKYFFVYFFSSLLLYEDYLRFPCRYYLPRRFFADLLDFPKYKTFCCTTVWTCWCMKYMISSYSLYTETDLLHIEFLKDFLTHFLPVVDWALLPQIDSVRSMIDDQSRCVTWTICRQRDVDTTFTDLHIYIDPSILLNER